MALVSCPSLYTKFKEKSGSNESKLSSQFSIEQYCRYLFLVKVFEFDKRFSQFGDDFIFYDYNFPLNVPENFKQYFDLVIADPPFLSDECLTKTAETIKYLSKDKIILCTGT